MKQSEHYNGCILTALARLYRGNQQWRAEISIVRAVGNSNIDTVFTTAQYFATAELAIQYALAEARKKVDAGFDSVIRGHSLFPESNYEAITNTTR
jgi:hypothetical protein